MAVKRIIWRRALLGASRPIGSGSPTTYYVDSNGNYYVDSNGNYYVKG
jgi:hypothetical protein